MRRNIWFWTAIWLLVFSLGCAIQTEPSPTMAAYARIRILEEAGFFPPDWNIPGASHAPQLQALERWTEKQGIVLALASLTRKGYMGHVSESPLIGITILVDRDLSPNTQLYALAHELGHVYSPDLDTIEARELFAELTAVQVCQGVGLDVWRQTALYLSRKTTLDEQARMVGALSRDVDQAVTRIQGAFHKA